MRDKSSRLGTATPPVLFADPMGERTQPTASEPSHLAGKEPSWAGSLGALCHGSASTHFHSAYFWLLYFLPLYSSPDQGPGLTDLHFVTYGAGADSRKSPSRPQAELIQQTEEKADWEASFHDVGIRVVRKGVVMAGLQKTMKRRVNSNPIELSRRVPDAPDCFVD